jgi:hypothetical protein
LGVLPILPKLPHFAPTFISKAPKKERERNGKEEAFLAGDGNREQVGAAEPQRETRRDESN